MSAQPYILGIDGGGTSTTASLADAEGTIVSVVEGGGSNLQTSGADRCAGSATALLIEICMKAGIDPGDVHIMVYGAAGAGRHEDREQLRGALEQRWASLESRPRRMHIVSDADIAIEAAFGGDPGIVVIAGTGSIVYGRDVDGAIKRAGGYGPVLGDPGSGMAVGLAGLRFLTQVFDGCNEQTYLVRLIGEQAGIVSHETLIEKIYNENFPPSRIAPMVIQAVEREDPNALAILREAARDLVALLGCGIRKFSFAEEIPVALAGGLLLSQTIYPELVSEGIREKHPNVRIHPMKYKPEEGAVAMGMRLLGTKHNYTQ
jgi:N-acetylglucosamine kinase-like BadF-type ATPase